MNQDPGGWSKIYRALIDDGLDPEVQRRGTAWLDDVLPRVPRPADSDGAARRALDLGCGLGADMLRLHHEGLTPVGIDGEARAATFVRERYGFDARCADFADPLPFDDGRFVLVTSRFALHFLDATQARRTLRDARRVLTRGGVLAFVVNADEHRRQGLQYDYRGAREVAPGQWHLPSIDRTYRFYTPERALDALGDGWVDVEIRQGPFDHWGIAKHALTCVAVRRG